MSKPCRDRNCADAMNTHWHDDASVAREPMTTPTPGTRAAPTTAAGRALVADSPICGFLDEHDGHLCPMCTDRLAGQVAKVEQEAAREAVEKVLSVARLADALETHRIQYRREIDEDREVVYVPDWKETARVLIAALRADTRTEQS